MTKFELYEEKRIADLDEKKKKNGKITFSEKYEDGNNQEVPEIIRKRKAETEEFLKRQADRREKMEEAESEGKLYIKKID